MTAIHDTLRALGVPRCYKGFGQTAYAIHLSLTEEERLESVTKGIYRDTAAHFHCQWTAVEHNIRTVAGRAWQTNPALLCRMAGYPLSGTPTASEFIEIVASYMLRCHLL